jgi:hypothetical protein
MKDLLIYKINYNIDIITIIITITIITIIITIIIINNKYKFYMQMKK